MEFQPVVEQWATYVLTWIGFGTVVGLLAKAIMPGPDPGGAVATLCMGLGGAVIGCSVLSFCWAGQRVWPLSPIGSLAAVAGGFVILAFYRLLGGYWFTEGDHPSHYYRRPHAYRRRRRRTAAVHHDD